MNKIIIAVALFGAVMGDGTGHGHSAPAASASGYAAPADAYASPAAEYAAPSYEAPAASYGAPTYEQEYAAPAYEAAPTGYDSGYGAPATEGLDFDLRQLKFDLINAILNPFSLQVANCTPANGVCTANC